MQPRYFKGSIVIQTKENIYQANIGRIEGWCAVFNSDLSVKNDNKYKHSA